MNTDRLHPEARELAIKLMQLISEDDGSSDQLIEAASTLIDEANAKSEYDPLKGVCPGWTVGDMITAVNMMDKEISDEDAVALLYRVGKEMSASTGVDWDMIQFHAKRMHADGEITLLPIQTFFKTIYKVVVLSDRLPEEDLHSVAREAVEGDYSWQYEITSQEQVTPDQMANLLKEQGSDPSFLLGEDYEE